MGTMTSSTGGGMTKDVVCGMDVSEKESEYQSQYGGQQFYFCSEDCKRTFDRQPEDFATAAA
jgi:YHS domain-containing protein